MVRHIAPLLVMVLAMMMGCGRSAQTGPVSSHVDSVLFEEGRLKRYDHMKVMADSFELFGDLTELNANRWRGVSYYHQGQYRMAEVCYKKALECEVKTDQDQLCYNKVARRLSELLLVKGDYEGSLRVAIPAIARMDETGIGSDIDYAILLNTIGCCQLNLGRDEEAHKSFMSARERYANRWQTDVTSRGFQEAVLGTVYTSMAYINTRRYAESIYWIDRTEMLLNKYRQRHDARVEYFDEYQGRIEIMRAVAMQGLKKPKEAAKAYQEFLKTDYSKTSAGRINANDYLVAAQRYGEAADNYRYLDEMLEQTGMELSLDNIQLYMLPKFRANLEAGRRDSTRIIATNILTLLDSAITAYKNSATAELATIYDTHGKEAEIARHQADLTQQRLMSTGIALVLIIIFFGIYTLHKRNATQRLAAAHQKLEEAHGKLQFAYDKLEETTTAKERIESELRIARDIQHSIVPSEFPHREGLDLYAYMLPAKEVGGDLYDYLLEDNYLYICLGDVSGKGVPAALFMGQVTRMFHALAREKCEPQVIATRLNVEFTEHNENGMFVTLFIAYIDLNTGRMDYCNAGHNPPIINGKFMEMESNAPIGLWSELDFIGEHIDSIKGCPLLIYSDGLNEAENYQQEQFGDDRLLQIMKDNDFKDAKHVINYLCDAVEKHRNGAAPNDDLTVMMLKVD
jgi:serine phosphatase RsbU (regulator of sigma subunit)